MKNYDVEVLVACMNQKDFSFYEKMNIKTNAVFANQSDDFSYKEANINGKVAKLITTNDRGVGKNRNIAILFSSSKYLLFADDDLQYHDDYADTITNAFEKIPKADIIVFDLKEINYSNMSHVKHRRIKKIGRVRWYNFMRYSTPNIAIKRDSLLKNSLFFSLLYGGGAKYHCGEDTLFLREALRKKMRIYKYPAYIATSDKSTSTWFKGYTEKYFIDQGVIYANLFPKLKWLLAIYYAFKYSKHIKDFTFFQIYKFMRKGIKSF